MTWDRVERTLGASNLQTLQGKHVGIIGLGSGGGFVALALAMSGVGAFTLIDDDRLEESNIMRHVADRRYLGQPKADAVADLIAQRSPDVRLNTRMGRFEDHLDALDGLDLVVCAVDGELSKYKINEVALKRNLPVVYAGVYERGEGGDVCVIHPYNGPCYACWAGELREDIAIRRDSGEPLDYGMIGEDGTLEAEPGLWIHVTRVASVQADMALNELLRTTPVHRPLPGNTAILANVQLEIIDGEHSLPYTAIWATIDRDPACLVCGDATRAANRLAETQPEAEGVSLDDLMAESGLTIDRSLQETSEEDVS